MNEVDGIAGEGAATAGSGVNMTIVYDKLRARLLFSQRRTLRQRLTSRRFVVGFVAVIIAFQLLNILTISRISSLRTPRSYDSETYVHTDESPVATKGSHPTQQSKKFTEAEKPKASKNTQKSKKSSEAKKHESIKTQKDTIAASSDSDDDSVSSATNDDDQYYSETAHRRSYESGYRSFFPWFVFVYMAFILLISFKVRGPSRIFVSDAGIRFKWYSLPSSFCVPWSAIASVASRKISYFSVRSQTLKDQFYHSKSIELNVDNQSLTPMQWFCLQWICMGLPDPLVPRFNSRITTLKLDAQAIVHDSDRQQFIRVLEQKVGQQFMNPQLMELKGEGDGENTSFTKVWLDSMDSAAHGLDPLAANTVLAGGEYQIVDRLAAGGQAVTYCALRQSQSAPATKPASASASDLPKVEEQSTILKLPSEEREMVVLKEFVLPERGGSKIRNRALANIDHEASLLRQLHHPQIVKLVDSFVQGHRAYLVMEKIDGQSLRQIVQRDGVFNEDRVRLLATQMCQILHYLHAQKPPIIHQDFTPDNLLLQPDWKLVLIDFNVAEQLEQECTKTVVGKHCYMPPEQFRGHPSPQSDIYAMGATLFYLLTGEDPEPISISHPRKTNPQVSESLDNIVAHATNTDTNKRYSDASSVEQDLSQTLQPAMAKEPI